MIASRNGEARVVYSNIIWDLIGRGTVAHVKIYLYTYPICLVCNLNFFERDDLFDMSIFMSMFLKKLYNLI